MQAKAKITSKGQITIPRSVRRALGVREGDNLVFQEAEHGFTVTPARETSVFAKYRGIGTPGVGAGREAVLLATRELRGKDPEE